MRNKVFSLLLVVLLCFAIFTLVKPQKEESSLEKRELFERDDIKLNTILDGTFFDEVDTLFKDQFSNRDSLMQGYYEFKILLNKALTGFDNSAITFLSDDVIELSDGYLLNNILLYDESLLNETASRGYNISEVYLNYPNIKTYVYHPTRLEEKLYIPSESMKNYGDLYLETFLTQINPNIKVSQLSVNSMEDHKSYFYKSDFHWNNKGAYQGYSDIINMIAIDFPITTPKPIQEEVCYPYEFRGNIASEVGQLGQFDHICDYTLDGIDEYYFYVNGNPSDLNLTKNNYKDNGNNTMFSDYDIYFGSNDFERIFDFDKPDAPNVLVFCDSYFNVIQEWFASHFNKTVLIDLRANDGSFSLDYYINEYDIDLILFCQMYKNQYFNGNMFVPIN